ncbi:MAG: hypothetical protein E8D41_01275 [Nitrospira sp.]|nr:MAG: hypothetical protein E8D41_01275 [Nitrospira sp.]
MLPLDSRITKQQNRFLLDCSLGELKSIYLALFAQLRADPLADIDESDILLHVQMALQQEAQAVGVDVSDHADWSRFLGDTQIAPCEQRYDSYGEKRPAV